MISSRPRAIATLFIAAISVSVFAAPASANVVQPSVLISATGALPPGYSLYALDCYGSGTGIQLYSLNSTNASATPIGTAGYLGPGVQPCAEQPALNVQTSVAYYSSAADISGQQSLFSVNLTTGRSNTVGQLTTTAVGRIDITAIAIGVTGTAYALGGNEIYPLNLADATLGTPVPTGLNGVEGFAVDPRTGIFYTIDYQGNVSSVDPATGLAVFLGKVSFASGAFNQNFSLQIDTNGNFWVSAANRGAGLYTFARATISSVALYVGPITEYGDGYTTRISTQALLIAPTPVAPRITTAPALNSAIAGSAFTATIAATGSQLITYALTGALPAGLVLDPASGLISGTPTTPGAFSFAVTATNAAGSSEAVVFTQTITAALPVVSG